jgi:hypothetical protein
MFIISHGILYIYIYIYIYIYKYISILYRILHIYINISLYVIQNIIYITIYFIIICSSANREGLVSICRYDAFVYNLFPQKTKMGRKHIYVVHMRSKSQDSILFFPLQAKTPI